MKTGRNYGETLGSEMAAEIMDNSPHLRAIIRKIENEDGLISDYLTQYPKLTRDYLDAATRITGNVYEIDPDQTSFSYQFLGRMVISALLDTDLTQQGL